MNRARPFAIGVCRRIRGDDFGEGILTEVFEGDDPSDTDEGDDGHEPWETSEESFESHSVSSYGCYEVRVARFVCWTGAAAVPVVAGVMVVIFCEVLAAGIEVDVSGVGVE